VPHGGWNDVPDVGRIFMESSDAKPSRDPSGEALIIGMLPAHKSFPW